MKKPAVQPWIPAPYEEADTYAIKALAAALPTKASRSGRWAGSSISCAGLTICRTGRVASEIRRLPRASAHVGNAVGQADQPRFEIVTGAFMADDKGADPALTTLSLTTRARNTGAKDTGTILDSADKGALTTRAPLAGCDKGKGGRSPTGALSMAGDDKLRPEASRALPR
jgi:hypothetical protein